MTKVLIAVSIVLCGLSLFFQTARLVLLGWLALVALSKTMTFLHRQKILGLTMIIAGGAAVTLALLSGDYPDIKETEIIKLWSGGITGAIACLAGLILAFCESSERRLLRRLRANCQRQPYGRR